MRFSTVLFQPLAVVVALAVEVLAVVALAIVALDVLGRRGAGRRAAGLRDAVCRRRPHPLPPMTPLPSLLPPLAPPIRLSPLTLLWHQPLWPFPPPLLLPPPVVAAAPVCRRCRTRSRGHCTPLPFARRSCRRCARHWRRAADEEFAGSVAWTCPPPPIMADNAAPTAVVIMAEPWPWLPKAAEGAGPRAVAAARYLPPKLLPQSQPWTPPPLLP